MKALIIKDYLTIKKQMWFILVFIAIFSITSYNVSDGSSFSSIGFIIMISVMLPVTSMAYDERSKWNVLSATMPYSNKDLVLSKYVFGYIAVLLASLLSILIQGGIQLIAGLPIGIDTVVSILAICLISTLILAINIPVSLKFGVEKGRFIFIFVVMIFALVILGSGLIFNEITEFINNRFFLFCLLLTIVVIALNIISIKIAIKINK